jgi:hypothetical protein
MPAPSKIHQGANITTTVFHVVPVAGQWDIKRNGAPVATFDSKEFAVVRARDMARRAAPSRLLIFTHNRAVEEENSYGQAIAANAS